MILDSKISIEQYYEKVKHEYPGYTLEEFKLICRSPFEYTKEEMQSGELPVIRLKYFGTFLVYPKRAKAFLTRLTERFKENKVDRIYYFKIKKMIDNFLSDGNDQ